MQCCAYDAAYSAQRDWLREHYLVLLVTTVLSTAILSLRIGFQRSAAVCVFVIIIIDEYHSEDRGYRE
jgi:hypothetical protein